MATELGYVRAANLLHETPASGQQFCRPPELTNALLGQHMPVGGNGSDPASLILPLECQPAVREPRCQGNADPVSASAVFRPPFARFRWTRRASGSTLTATALAPGGNHIPRYPLVVVVVSKVAMR